MTSRAGCGWGVGPWLCRGSASTRVSTRLCSAEPRPRSVTLNAYAAHPRCVSSSGAAVPAATTWRVGRAKARADDAACPFHKLAPGLSGREAYSTEAIREGDTGVSIRLDAILARSLTEPPAPKTSGEQREGRNLSDDRTAGPASLAVEGGPADCLASTLAAPELVDLSRATASADRELLHQPGPGELGALHRAAVPPGHRRAQRGSLRGIQSAPRPSRAQGTPGTDSRRDQGRHTHPVRRPVYARSPPGPSLRVPALDEGALGVPTGPSSQRRAPSMMPAVWGCSS